MMVGKTFPAKFDFATWTRELSWILVPEPMLMLLTSPEHIKLPIKQEWNTERNEKTNDSNGVNKKTKSLENNHKQTGDK